MNYPTLVGDSNWYIDDQDYKTDISFSGHVLLGAKHKHSLNQIPVSQMHLMLDTFKFTTQIIVVID
ncbi:hypothetical protein [Pseudoalteromonas denitrificans]|uniref:Uncharacterized protein n=1 Tax=Pseudoalteromonas denitrificans DSM 6059 TaxID=1123010 RepID=A0A1I1GL01_9GAMM|nr:hypothetical protein [Pseudoalteromonas denitrificans]SFC12151.1 hypothetical protein SAMN02745724_00938 [Pseudoalteromonas denitrificans DSM 6059]